MEDFQIEKFYPIKDNPEMLLRLTIGMNKSEFWVESDLISKSGQKIIYSLGLRQKNNSYFDAIQAGLNLYYKNRWCHFFDSVGGAADKIVTFSVLAQ